MERTIAAQIKLARAWFQSRVLCRDAGRADAGFGDGLKQPLMQAPRLWIFPTTGSCLPRNTNIRWNTWWIMCPILIRPFPVLPFNDLGLATANSIAGAIGGARQIECTINSIGGAPTASLEEVVMVIKTSSLKFIPILILPNYSPWVIGFRYKMRMVVQPNKAVVGDNAYSHSSGIHQDGFEKPPTYEIIAPP